jgi:putative ABC transport system permease protein
MKAKNNAIRPRWRKVWADLWDSKMRTLLVVTSIAVGVFSIGMIVTAYDYISKDLNISYSSVHPANIEIWTDPFYEDFVRSIEKIPGVEDAEGRHVFSIRASKDGASWLRLDLIAIEDFEKTNINLLSLIEGTPIPGRREILINRDPSNDTGFRVGDELQIQLQDDTIRNMQVVGIVGDQATGASDFLGSSLAYTTLDTLEWLGQDEYFHRLYVTVSGNSNDENVILDVSEAIEDKIERSGRRVYRTQTSITNEHPKASLAVAIMGVLGAMGVLIMLLSSSLIVNTLNALLSQHLRQIGVMKLVGARSVQILGMYLILILAFGLIALVIAVPLGGIAGYGLAKFIVNFLNAELQGFRVVPLAIVLQVLIAIFVPLIAGFVPVNNGSKIKVRQAISNDRLGDQPSSHNWLNKLGEWILWISRPTLLSIRNIFRRKGRLMLTLFTLTMAGAIFIAVFNVRSSMERFIDQLGQHFMADITLNFSVPYRISKVERAVFQVPGIIDLEAWAATSAEILDQDDNVVENIQIIAPPADSSLLDPEMVAGRWLLPGDQEALVVSDSIYDFYPELRPGDTLRVKVSGQREEDWTVVGVFRFTNMIGNTMAYADYDFISSLINLPYQAFSYRLVTSEHTLERQEIVSQTLDQHLRDRGFHVSSIEVGLVTREQIANGINIIVVFLLTMAILTAIVGSIGLTGTMGMNVMERTREIGVMRAIGAVDLAVIKSVVVEGVFIGMITWFLAVFLSFPISYLLLTIISKALINSPLPLYFTMRGFTIWLAAVLILSVLASVLPARNAARLTIREVLAYE